MKGKIEICEKTRQNAKSKQTFDLTPDGKIAIEGKTRQNAETKQTFGLTGKNEIKEKLEAENNQAFDLTGKFKNNAWRDRSTYGTITKGQSEFR